MPNFNIPEPSITLYSPFTMILNGIIAFLSPCIVPMIPIYVSYILGSSDGSSKITKTTIIKLLGLVLGFVIVFASLGAIGGLAGSITSQSKVVRNVLNIVSNILLIIFGLMMLEVIPGLTMFTYSGDSTKYAKGGFFQNMLFGAVLVLSWSPCLTPTLGTALTAVASSSSSNVLIGIYMLSLYALGLSVPFVILILLYQKLSSFFNIIKKYNILIRKIAGVLMILIGILNFLPIKIF